MPETTIEAGAVVRELEIAARPETIWEFLVDPEKVIRWLGTAATIDPTPGGEYSVTVLPHAVARGQFVELDPPNRLVYTFGWEGTDPVATAVPPGSTTVEIQLTPIDERTTRLRFEHRGLPDEETVGKHAHGWEHYLDRLGALLSGDDPGRDPWLDQAPNAD